MAMTAHGTLTPNEVKEVALSTSWRSKGIEIVNRSMTGTIWVRFDGQNPTVGGAGCFAVLGSRSYDHSGNVRVKMISDEALAYSVEAA